MATSPNYGPPSILQNIADGMIYGTRIRPYRYTNLEFGPIQKIRGIVLHQTNSSTASATLAAYIFRSTGAHFLIDPDGQIIQTASIARVCHYVGPIKSRCYETATCSPQEKKVLDAIVNGPGSRDQKRMAVNNHERAKSVPYRYPSNYDSLGIEVSGSFDEKTKHYQTPSTAQNLSAIWLIGELLSAFSLTRSDVYRHPQLSYKENDEAARVKF